MNCLVVSPGKGLVGMCRFSAVNIEHVPFRDSKETIKSAASERFRDLDRRMAAPLELSAALRARLSACRDGAPPLEGRN